MVRYRSLIILPFLCLGFVLGYAQQQPVDYVNPYMGNISHLLVPTYPTIHLPNSLLRVYPERDDFTGNQLKGLPMMVTSHRGRSAFNLSPYQGDAGGLKEVIKYGYDNEVAKPYYYEVDLDDQNIGVRFAPSHQSAIYELSFPDMDKTAYLVFNSQNGQMKADSLGVSGYQELENHTVVYVYAETAEPPSSAGVFANGQLDTSRSEASGNNACVVLSYKPGTGKVHLRYGISFISVAQARKNLHRELNNYNLHALAQTGKDIWNKTLGKMEVSGDDANALTVFYTSVYRTYERMICLSEDGHYFSAFDGKVHDDGGTPFYTDDWVWDTYRATHPLRVIFEPQMEVAMLSSYIRMAEQMDQLWMPTFPEVTGDSRRMNSNHAVAALLDAYNKGLRGVDLEKGYEACKNALTQKTLAPWSGKKAGVLDQFFKDHGYFPALANGETETVPEVHSWERRQPVAVTLGTVYDEWCLAQLAKALGKSDDYQYFLKRSLNYRLLFNKETKFFHPKDSMGRFIEPFDYTFSGGIGARDAYDENNGWVYRWDVQHNIADLVQMMGGKEAFVAELEGMFSTPIGRGKPDFYHQFGDLSGIVGEFSMANEPALHIPYLYNYAGQPWRTQKRIRSLLRQWFRNDLMGVPGDEDGGGMSAFVAFSSLGFYPVTPGLPMYVIGSPMFKNATLHLGNGKVFELECQNYAPDNKFIQSVTLNGKVWDQSWFSHEQLMRGGKMLFVMGKKPNKQWASGSGSIPPSFEMPLASAKN